MKDNCDVCGQDFVIEPGFYFGAMFIGYGFMVWLSFGLVGILHWVLDWSLMASAIVLIVLSAIFFVYIFRLARSIWIGVNVKYDPQSASRKA